MAACYEGTSMIGKQNRRFDTWWYRQGRPRTLKVSGRKSYLVLGIVALLLILTACESSPGTSTGNKVKNQSISTTNNGVITYSASPQEVLIRTFYGGGKLGSFEYSPEISIYGDGSYILGPGLQMREGQAHV